MVSVLGLYGHTDPVDAHYGGGALAGAGGATSFDWRELVQDLLHIRGQLCSRRVAFFGPLGQAAQDDRLKAWRQIRAHLAWRLAATC